MIFQKIWLLLIVLHIFCPERTMAVYLIDPKKETNGTPNQMQWDACFPKNNYHARGSYYLEINRYGYLLPSDPTYGIPKYKKGGCIFSMEDSLFFLRHVTQDGMKNRPEKFTAQQMANYWIKNAKILVEQLKARDQIRAKLLKKPNSSEYSSLIIDPDKENKASITHSSINSALPEDDIFDDLVLGARDTLNRYMCNLKYFYDDLKKRIYEFKNTIAQNFHWHSRIKISEQDKIKISPDIWKPILEKIKANQNLASFHKASINTHGITFEEKAYAFALCHYWIEHLGYILQQVDDFLDAHDLRGKRHTSDYSPPPLDLTRNYWKNAQGQWCSGYGVIFDKLGSSDDLANEYAELKPQDHPWLGKERLVDSIDYREIPFQNENNYIHMKNGSNNIIKIPSEWLQAQSGWSMLFPRQKGTYSKGVEEYKALDALDMEGAQDLIAQMNIMISSYSKAEKLAREKMLSKDKQGKEWNVSSAQYRLYSQPLQGHRDQLTQFILQIVGPYYDNIKESLTVAEKTITELGQSIPKEKWHPMLITFSKKPVNATLLNQDSPEKKLAAAYHILEKLKPVETQMDQFLDQHIFLRGVVYLFGVYEGYTDYSVYHWKNAHGYTCRGFGRLLSPRKTRPPMKKNIYYEKANALIPFSNINTAR